MNLKRSLKAAVVFYTVAIVSHSTAELTEAECLECGDILQTFPRFAVVNRGDFRRGCRLESCEGRRLSCESGKQIRKDKVFSRDGAFLRCTRIDGVNLAIVEVTESPTSNPTNQPTTLQPTEEPTTPPPTFNPTREPTTRGPTFNPTRDPTSKPTRDPTREPTTLSPTREPTNIPTTAAPSSEPTLRPSGSPTTFVPTTTESLNAFIDDGGQAGVIAGASVAGLVVIVAAFMAFRRRSRRVEFVKNASMPTPVPVGTPSSIFPGDVAEQQARSTGFMAHLYRRSVDYLNARRYQGRVKDAQDDYDDNHQLPHRQPTLGPPPGMVPLPGMSYPPPSPRRQRPMQGGNSPRGGEMDVETPPPAPPRKRRKKLPGLQSSLDEEETPPPAPPRARRKKRRGALRPQHRRPRSPQGRRVSPERGDGSPFPPHRWGGDDMEDEDEDDEDVKF